MENNIKGFKICTFNCNGILESRKRKDVFDFIRNLNCNIYFLQETHLVTKSENFIRSCWGYNVWLSGAATNKNGVGILFNNNFEYKLHKVVKDSDGCFIIMDIEFLNKRFTMINVYGPSSGDNPDFFEKISEHIDQFDNEYIISAGDWNCVLNMNKDARNYQSTVNRPRTRKKLFDIMTKHQLIDIWRELYPDKRAYTWRKFNSIKQGRLDYFLISEELFPEVTNVKIDSAYRSDHSIVVLSLKKLQIKRDRPFWKFNNSLLKDINYVNVIKKLILNIKQQYALPVYNIDNLENIENEQIQFMISDQLFFETLLLEIRGKSISYASYKKKHENNQEHEIIQKIQELESNISENSLFQIEELKTQLQDIRNKKIDGMMIRSRVNWIQNGEKGSRFFCNLEKRNFVDKSMGFLENENGDIISEQKNILKEVKNFYQNLYSEKETIDVNLEELVPDIPILTEEHQQIIEGPITFTEAAASLKNMKNNKSPGPDGFTVEFFKFFFIDLGTFLVRSINNGFQTGQLSVTQTQGLITCIPKEGKPKQFIKNWRPISLLNISYKIASACLANRFKSVLPKIIHSNQTGFLKGRYIGENIRLIYDTISYAEEHQIPGLLLMIDFEKAFDSVSWSFLQKALKLFNFGPDIRRWIEVFYNNANSCVSVNGQYSEWFDIRRGVRQGDPCSPYLFLICAEVLSNMIRSNKNIKGIKLKETEFLLSQFADDTTLALDGTEKSFTECIYLLDKFSLMSGLKINNDKTIAVWIGSRKNCDVQFLRDRNFCWDPGIFKVLGVKLSTNIKNINEINYDGKLLKIQKILKTWKKRQLSPIGKVTVIKTLIIPIIIYLFSNLPDPPDSFLKDIDTEFYQFLWDNKPSKIKKTCCM